MRHHLLVLQGLQLLPEVVDLPNQFQIFLEDARRLLLLNLIVSFDLHFESLHIVLLVLPLVHLLLATDCVVVIAVLDVRRLALVELDHNLLEHLVGELYLFVLGGVEFGLLEHSVLRLLQDILELICVRTKVLLDAVQLVPFVGQTNLAHLQVVHD